MKKDTVLINLEKFFAETELPTDPIRLDGHTTIQSPADFVFSHLETLRNLQGRSAEPYRERLILTHA